MRSLGRFSGDNYDKGRGVHWQVMWLAVSGTVFTRWWCPNQIRILILRWFGAKIGHGVIIKPHVKIHWPWKLSVGPNSWIGEQAWLLNLETISIGNDTCISQDVFICTGSHDHKSSTFEFDNAPVQIGSGTWLAARSTVLRGVTIGDDAVIGCSALITKDVPNGGFVRATDSQRDELR